MSFQFAVFNVSAEFVMDVAKAIASSPHPLSKTDILNSFKTDYGMGSPRTAKEAAKIFAFLAQKAEIGLSQSIIDELATKERKRPAGIIRKKKTRLMDDKGMKEQLEKDVLARLTLKGTGIIDVKDKDTFEIAQAYMNLLSKKLGITEEKESQETH